LPWVGTITPVPFAEAMLVVARVAALSVAVASKKADSVFRVVVMVVSCFPERAVIALR
jgi:hypothetical protein